MQISSLTAQSKTLIDELASKSDELNSTSRELVDLKPRLAESLSQYSTLQSSLQTQVSTHSHICLQTFI